MLAPTRRRASLPELSFVIVNWNTAGHLRRCLAALPAAAGGRGYEVIVVDNGSSDGSADVAAQAAGPFDEGVFTYGEDWDLCLRLRRLGWRIAYLPRLLAVHAHNVSGEQAFGERREARVLASLFYFQRKHHGGAYAATVALVCGLGAGLRLLLVLPASGTRWGRRQARRHLHALQLSFGPSGLLHGLLPR